MNSIQHVTPTTGVRHSGCVCRGVCEKKGCWSDEFEGLGTQGVVNVEGVVELPDGDNQLSPVCVI